MKRLIVILALGGLVACESDRNTNGQFDADRPNGTDNSGRTDGDTTPHATADPHDTTRPDNTDGSGRTDSAPVGSDSTNGVDTGNGVDTSGELNPDADYLIDPPDTCQTRFTYEQDMACISGNPNTLCGGVCRPRNACENAPGKDGPVGFACSRYMMFSPAMEKAVKDDAASYQWPNPEDPPFVYAVGGHDTNTSGIDAGMRGSQPCCECYQAVFTEPDSEWTSSPPPKPLIIQVFNIAATSQSFDLYMGAGGFGAHNACADNGLAGTYGSYLYSGYPVYGQANDGGIKTVRLDECKSPNTAPDWTMPNPESLGSAACQGRIESMCNEITADNAALQAITRKSCIEGNRVNSMYHQNRKILVKRINCPQHLTRVTGCRLAHDPSIPDVDPTAITPDAARAKGFLDGYHTTTMQDCCKPACAWSDNVAGTGKVTESPWDALYTCTANDEPMIGP